MEHRVDAWMILSILGILAASLVTLQSQAEVVGAQLVVRQLLWGLAGLLLLWSLSRVNPSLFERIAPAAYLVGLMALAAVLLWGEVRSGTKGWFALGPLTIQPSEFARLGVAMMVASWLARRSSSHLSLRDTLVLGVMVGLPFLLVFIEPDLGVALTYLPLLVCGLWLGGLRKHVWIMLTLVCILGAVSAWFTVLKPYQKERVISIVNPEHDPFGAGYQVRQSKIAVGSGGFLGSGLGRGSQVLLRFLPAQHTDFIFAAWAEATGLVGTSALLTLYVLLLGRLAHVTALAETHYGVCLTTLIGSWFAFQVVLNLGVVLGWLPTTGITLPLFSYGGSSLLTTCAALGIVQSIKRFRFMNQ